MISVAPRARACLTHRRVQSLLSLAMDSDGDIRRLVCQGLVALIQAVPERLQSNMSPIVQYMLARNQARALKLCGSSLVADHF